MNRYALRDDQWERSKDLLPGKPGDVGVTAHDNRRFVRRFSRWAKKGVWQRLFEHLAAEPDNEYAMIDSTIVRAHQHSAGAQKKMTIKPSAAARAD